MGISYTRCLTPSDIDCPYSKLCNRICYANCSVCAMNLVAVKKFEEEKKKKNYFKRIR